MLRRLTGSRLLARKTCYSVPSEGIIDLGDGPENKFKMKPNFFERVADPQSVADADKYHNNVERYIGTVKIPVGIVGPVKLKHYIPSLDQTKEIETLVPFATTEGALTASYTRGAKAIREGGGAQAVCLHQSMVRAPFWSFDNVVEAAKFHGWLLNPKTMDAMNDVIATTPHCHAYKLEPCQFDRSVTLLIGCSTDCAAGQNMTTFAGRDVLKFVAEHYPGRAQIRASFIESGFNSGKRGSALHLAGRKGSYTIVDAVIPRSIVEKTLKTTPEEIVDFQRTHFRSSAYLESLSFTAHASNGLTATFIALGQDPAAVAESQCAVTHFALSNGYKEADKHSDLYASCTLPSIIVATIGGGTALPSQKACLDVLEGVDGPFDLAAVIATVVLGGELSFYAAMASNQFDRAHYMMTHKT